MASTNKILRDIAEDKGAGLPKNRGSISTNAIVKAIMDADSYDVTDCVSTNSILGADKTEDDGGSV
jgi:hypothetical protein